MNVSTFTKGQKYKLIALLAFFTVVLASTRRFPFVVIAVASAAVIAFLVMRTRILRHFANTPIRQVAYVSLIEPVYHYYNAKAGEDENGRPIMERRREVVGHRRRDTPHVQRIDPCYVNILRYIEEKKNPSVMISGLPGMGKTELMKLLLLHLKMPKTILSFKPNDAYLRLPYQVVDVSKHIPNPFQDPDAFSIAYDLAFPANVMGIMLSQARTMIKNLASESRDWNEFRQNLKSMQRKTTEMQTEALALIQGQIESLAIGEGSFSIDLAKDTVLDFSRIDESAKTFYAEIALRQIWKALPSRTAGAQDGENARKVVIVIDEVHRLMQLYEEFGVKSVIDALTRMARQFGALYTATQNYSDVPDKLRNLFGTRFTFNTSSEKDMNAIRAIDSGYAWAAKELLPYRFVDVTFKVGNDGIFPVFQADTVELPERAVDYDEPAGIVTSTHPQRDERDYENEILNVLKASPLHQTGIEHALGIEREDSRRLKVKDALKRLTNANEVGRIKYVDEAGKEKVFCYISDPNLSPIHDYMQKETASRLQSGNVKVLRLNKTGSGAVADIETPDFDVEIETGLKRSASDLEERLSKSTKAVIIVVPNYEEKGRYSKYASNRVKVVVIPELLDAAKVVTAEARSAGGVDKEPPTNPLKEGGEPTRRVGEGT